jgi:peptidyl-dipeptidase A
MRRKARTASLALLVCCVLQFAGASNELRAAVDPALQAEAERFLALYNSLYRGMFTIMEGSGWMASTDVRPENDGRRIAGGQALAALVGDRLIIERLRHFRAQADRLEPSIVRQLEAAWLEAAEAPGTAPELVTARIEAETRQSSTLDGYTYCLGFDDAGECVEPISANEIDDRLITSRNLDERLRIWTASKEIGKALRPGLVELQRLRNELAREMGYDSFFALQVADYGMTVDEMMDMLRGWIEDIWPLYLELHTWAKHALAERYGEPVPDLIPAHWLGNRWAQSWPGLVEAVDLDGLFADRSARWIVEQAERFYVSMGFDPLPESFYERSDLYPVPVDSERKKNTHASAWHIDLDRDVRSLMSVTNNSHWFLTTHHELGHIYYYMSYTRPDVPVILRKGANRGFHEGIGELISIAASQRPYLQEVGLLDEGQEIDPILWLLNEALTETLVFLPWAAGTISHWEHDLYQENLPSSQWNARWWEYVARFQGVAPPSVRAEEFCDPATKTHVNDDPAQYYDYAFAAVLKYQLHDHIARTILRQPMTAANYYGSQATGDFLRSILEVGATRGWRELLVETTGQPLSTKPMMEYFAPLMQWLQEQNEGRSKGW